MPFPILPKMPYPLLFITLLTVIFITSNISYHSINFTTTTNSNSNTNHENIILPYSLHNQISNLQTQVGALLEQLHSDANNSKSLANFSQKVLEIAMSLDKLADNLSHLYSDQPINTQNDQTSKVYEDFGENEDEESDDQDASILDKRLFHSTEISNYTSPKPNRNNGKKSFLGTEAVYPSIGLSCINAASNIDNFMSYKLYGTCPDDWILAQKLIIQGCDPLPIRRCFSRSPPHYTKPLPINTSHWNPPCESNILWTHYKCKHYSCLVSDTATGNNRGFYKCADCFNLTKRGWEEISSDETASSAEFSIDQVLGLKPGEIRIGLDFSPSTGTFAAIMREKYVTIATATLNLGAPFNEVIALRGLLPLYISIGSRLPFFDNTLDIVHSTLFLDGWISLEVLQYVLFDWDRVLRPKGIIWVDRFFCGKDELKVYLDEFSKLGYKKLLWRVVTKTGKVGGEELFFSAVLEKPLRL